MNTKRIETAVSDAYQKGGLGAACEEANKHLITEYEFCNLCDTEVPTIKGDHICLACGSTTRNELQDELDKENI